MREPLDYRIKEYCINHPWTFALFGLAATILGAYETYDSYMSAPPGGTYEIQVVLLILGPVIFIAGLIACIIKNRKNK